MIERTIIPGPPGTGKTVKVVSINAFTAEKGKDEPPPIERPPFVK